MKLNYDLSSEKNTFEKKVVCKAPKVSWNTKTYDPKVVSSFDDLFLNPVFPTWVFQSELKGHKIFMNRFLIACISDIPLQIISDLLGIHKNVWYGLKHFTKLDVWPHVHYNLRDFQIVQYERWCLLKKMHEIKNDFRRKLDFMDCSDPFKPLVFYRVFNIFVNTLEIIKMVHSEARHYNKFMKTLSISNMENMDSINALGIYDIKKNFYLAAVFDMKRADMLHPDSFGSKTSFSTQKSFKVRMPGGVSKASRHDGQSEGNKICQTEIETVQLETSLSPLEDWIHFYG